MLRFGGGVPFPRIVSLPPSPLHCSTCKHLIDFIYLFILMQTVYNHMVGVHKKKSTDMKTFFRDAKAKLEVESKGCQRSAEKDKEDNDDDPFEDADNAKEDSEVMSHVTVGEFAL